MTSFPMRLIIIVLSLSFAAAAQAQSEDWYVGSSIIWNDDDADRRIDDSFSGLNVTLGMDLTRNLTLEGLLGYSKIDGYYRPSGTWVRGSQNDLDLSANLLAFYDRDATFAPYAMLGVGYLGISRSPGDKTRSPTGSWGLGFKWRLGQSDYSIRGEYRSRIEFDNSQNFNDRLMTLGVQYDFAGSSRALPAGSVQESARNWYVSGSIAYFDDDPDRRLDAGLTGLQFNVGRNITDRLTVEGHLGYHDIDGYYLRNGLWVRGSETQLDLSANLLAFYDRSRPFAPYLIIGVGYLGQSVEGGGDENRPSGTLGAGFKWRIGQSRFSIRNEYRARLAYEKDLNFMDFIATLGVEYNFGARARDLGIPPDRPADTDGDGVLDMWDECPDTPPGVNVTSKGCEIKDMDRDADGDRVPDYRDYCLDTPTGAPVDAQGCSLDSDLDGVTTDKDRCPGSRIGAEVDEFGCENDDDKDGVPDHRDRCLDTRFGVEVDVYGCEIRDIISLPGVNFKSGSDLLETGAEELIKIAAQTLNKNPNLRIEVAGHTDSQGDEIDNLGLSDRRAKTVFDYLFLYGVDPKRLTFKGYGETQPIADNETAEGRAINRRVELRVTRQ